MSKPLNRFYGFMHGESVQRIRDAKHKPGITINPICEICGKAKNASAGGGGYGLPIKKVDHSLCKQILIEKQRLAGEECSNY